MKINFLQRQRTLSLVLISLLMTAGITIAYAQAPTGAINGVFSVGENTGVCFSQGNLQYKASTNQWQFAANQYDYIGSANSNISSTYTGWIDLFGWGTSGYHDANDPYNVNYQPWSTSGATVNSDYNYYGYGPSTNMADPNLTGSSANYDWGVYNAISNGGNTTNTWRTLTKPEWVYLFNTRATSSGIRYAKAQVNNVNGVILLPDDWSSDYYTLTNTNTYDASFSTNVITASQWAVLEQHGAVFLPAAGYRNGASVDGVGSYGGYWSASYYDSRSAYSVYFGYGNLGTSGDYYRYYGRSVRLVRTVENYSIQATPSPAEGGAVSGAGAYMAGAGCTLTATASAGYTFAYWTENGEVVSTDAEYTFTVTGDRTLVANFTQNGSTGKLNGQFTVGENAVVCFSQGNLQYKASTNQWQFAANQYDYIGSANSNISSTYTGWIDLFGWGTSGYNHGANCYQPWSISTTNSDYYAYGNSSYNLFDQSGQADWGYNAISNGGNTTNTWRTLTQPEWAYLFNTRTTASGIRYAKAQVNNVNGVILLPDDWSADYYSLNSTNTYNASFSTNVITASQWATLEQHGAVFLPAAGYRYGASVSGVGSNGYYWSASCDLSYGAYYVGFYDGSLYTGYGSYRYYGLSVRLVRTVENYSIQATPSPAEGGAVSGAGAYMAGAECTLTATASVGYTFVNWTENGEVVSTDAEYTFTVTGDRTLAANFSPNVYTVTLNTNGGTINSGNVTSYTYGVGATLPTNVTRTGYTFNGWYDNSGLTGSAVTSIPTTATGNKTYWAKWTINSYSIAASANPTGGGSVSGAGTYNYGASCTLTATPASGYNFIKWTKNGSQVSTSAAYTFTVNGAGTYVAQFTKKTYAITATANPAAGGSVTGAGTYEHGSNVTLKATAATGYSFVKWTKNGAQVSTNPTYNFTATSAGDYVAHFSLNSYAITATANPAEAGTITGAGTYTYGETCTLTVTTNYQYGSYQYKFVNWTENGQAVSTDNTLSFTVTANRSLVANFEQVDYHWTPVPGMSGSMTILGILKIDGVEPYADYLEIGAFSGTECRGSALPEFLMDYCIYSLNVSGNTDGDPVTFKVYDHHLGQELDLYCTNELAFADGMYYGMEEFYEFNFLNYYQVTASMDPADAGTVTGTDIYVYGTSCTLTAIANTGYHFVNWTQNGNTVSNSPEYTFEVTGAGDYVAHFALNSYTITAIADPAEGGSVTGAGTYTHGTTVTLSATANTGYAFEHWTKDGAEVSTDATYSFTATEAGTYTAHFTLNSYAVTVTANPAEGGIIEGAGNFGYGQTCTLTAAANEGWQFNSWMVDGETVSTETTYSFTVEGPANVTALFDLAQTVELKQGWTWWGTGVELTGIDGLSILEEGLNPYGRVIKNNEKFVQYQAALNRWIGGLNVLTNEEGYKVNASQTCPVTIVGPAANPEDHPITIHPNWTWIGYPASHPQAVGVALAGFNPEVNDIIKSQSSSARYLPNVGWIPATFTLNPGESYMYYSKAADEKTLVYANGRSAVTAENDDRHWRNDAHAFADNLCLLAVVEIDGMEQRTEELELGAFVNGECRGSAKLMYIEPLDRYYAMMTVVGEDGEVMEFALTDHSNLSMQYRSEALLTFATDAIIGEFDNPFVVRFGGLSSVEEQDLTLGLYPNPVGRNESFRLLVPEEETVTEWSVVNALGAVVRHEAATGTPKETRIEGLPVSGVYLVKVSCQSGKVYWNRLIVK